jgi:hypothetical protein
MTLDARAACLLDHEFIDSGLEEDEADKATDAVGNLIDMMKKMHPDARIMVFAALDDFFCRRCGIEQPEGDCQCK